MYSRPTSAARMRAAGAFGWLLLVLAFRPQGLFGERVAEKA